MTILHSFVLSRFLKILCLIFVVSRIYILCDLRFCYLRALGNNKFQCFDLSI